MLSWQVGNPTRRKTKEEFVMQSSRLPVRNAS